MNYVNEEKFIEWIAAWAWRGISCRSKFLSRRERAPEGRALSGAQLFCSEAQRSGF